ncbi:hypothetical protein [Macrococcus capreoli]|uniref:hypothetical protein n=1 Tax=Macrococcus capreoli TaxID=2982690 RepID=UPI003F426555
MRKYLLVFTILSLFLGACGKTYDKKEVSLNEILEAEDVVLYRIDTYDSDSQSLDSAVIDEVIDVKEGKATVYYLGDRNFQEYSSKDGLINILSLDKDDKKNIDMAKKLDKSYQLAKIEEYKQDEEMDLLDDKYEEPEARKIKFTIGSDKEGLKYLKRHKKSDKYDKSKIKIEVAEFTHKGFGTADNIASLIDTKSFNNFIEKKQTRFVYINDKRYALYEENKDSLTKLLVPVGENFENFVYSPLNKKNVEIDW